MVKFKSLIFILAFSLSVVSNASDDLGDKVQSVVKLLRDQTPTELNLKESSLSYESHRMGFALIGFVECEPKQLQDFLAENAILQTIPRLYQVEALKLALMKTEYKCVLELLSKFDWLHKEFFQDTEPGMVAGYIKKNPSEWKRYQAVDKGKHLQDQDNSESEEDCESSESFDLRLSYEQAVKTLSLAMKLSSSFKHKYYKEPETAAKNTFLLNEIDFLQEFILDYFSLTEMRECAGELFYNAFLAGNRELAGRILARKPGVCYSMYYHFLIHDVIAKTSHSSEAYQDVDKFMNASDVCFLVRSAILQFNAAQLMGGSQQQIAELEYFKRSFCKTVEMAVMDAARLGRDDILRFIMNLPVGSRPDFSMHYNMIPDMAMELAVMHGHSKTVEYLIQIFLTQLPMDTMEKFAGRALVLAALNWKKSVVSYLLSQTQVTLYSEYLDSAILNYDGKDEEMIQILEAAKLIERPSLGNQPNNLSNLFQLRNR